MEGYVGGTHIFTSKHGHKKYSHARVYKVFTSLQGVSFDPTLP